MTLLILHQQSDSERTVALGTENRVAQEEV